MVESLSVQPAVRTTDMAEEMKSIRKQKMQRQVFENPEMARDLVKTEASATYNARGNLVQAVSGDLGNA